MNLTELNIVETAINSFNSRNEIKFELIDDCLHLNFNSNTLQFNPIIKPSINNSLPGSYSESMKIIVFETASPKAKELLRNSNICYIQTNGSCFIKNDKIYVFIDIEKPLIKSNASSVGRAFTKTGIKLLFSFLLDNSLINKPYREISNITGIAFSNINYIINGLKELNYIMPIDKRKFKLYNTNELVNTWVQRYNEKLKPSLHIANFKFSDTFYLKNWKQLELNSTHTLWSGEPAANIINNYLIPEELTLYTTETKQQLINNYKLIPDTNGNIKVYEKFWMQDKSLGNIAPYLIIYADLIGTYDSRNIETAVKIYEEFLKH